METNLLFIYETTTTARTFLITFLFFRLIFHYYYFFQLWSTLFFFYFFTVLRWYFLIFTLNFISVRFLQTARLKQFMNLFLLQIQCSATKFHDDLDIVTALWVLSPFIRNLFCWCFFLLLLARVVSRKKETTQMPEDDFSALHFRPNWNFQQQLLPQNSLRLLQSHQTSTWNAKPTDKSRLPIFILFCDSRKSVHLTATGKICGFHDKNFTSTIRGTTKRESRRSVPNYFFPSALDDWNSKTPRRKTSLVSCSGWWWIPSIVRKRKY